MTVDDMRPSPGRSACNGWRIRSQEPACRCTSSIYAKPNRRRSASAFCSAAFSLEQPFHRDIALSEEERNYLEELYRPRDMINDYNPTRRPRALGA